MRVYVGKRLIIMLDTWNPKHVQRETGCEEGTGSTDFEYQRVLGVRVLGKGNALERQVEMK